MDIQAICDGLAARLLTIKDPTDPNQQVRAEANVPDVVNVPQFYVSFPYGQGNQPLVDYDLTSHGGSHRLFLFATLLVEDVLKEQAQAKLRPYLGDGQYSVYAAVHADRTLGGLPVDAAVKRALNYGPHEVNGVQYLGCSFVIEVLVNG